MVGTLDLLPRHHASSTPPPQCALGHARDHSLRTQWVIERMQTHPLSLYTREVNLLPSCFAIFCHKKRVTALLNQHPRLSILHPSVDTAA